MANRIQLRRDTTANWESVNPILADGEPGYDIVTNEVRIGDGSTAWTGLTGNVISGGSSGTTRWDATPAVAGCPIYAELTPDHFEAYTQKSHLGVNNTGSWDIGSNYMATGLYSLDDTAVTLYSNRGNVVVRTGDSSQYFRFGADGTLTLPGDIQNGTAGLSFPSGGVYLTTNLDDDNNALYFDPTSHDAQLYVGGNITLSTAVVPGDSELDWTFGTAGDLTLPGGGLVSPNGYNRFSTKSSVWAVGSDYAGLDWKGTNTIYASASGVEIYTNSSGTGHISGNENYWLFGTDGHLGAPGEITITTNNTHGGAGYTGFLTLTSTQGGVTNPNKFIRLNSTGNLQIVNSAYTQTIFDLGDSGDLTLPGNVTVGNVVTTGTANIGGNLIVGGNLLLSAGGQIQSPAGTGNVTIEANDGNNVRTYTFGTDGNITFPDGTKQGTAGGPGAITNSSNGSDAYQMTNERFMFVNPNGHLTSVILPQTPVDGQQATIVRTTGASIFANVVGSMTIAPTVSNPTGGNLMIDKHDINTQSSISFVADLASHTWWLTAQVGF
jgi:hypothetical protein